MGKIVMQIAFSRILRVRVLVAALLVATSAARAQEAQLIAHRTCAIVYRELAGPAADLMDIDLIDAQIERLGLRVLRGDDEENAEFRISAVVRHFPANQGAHAFSSFEYHIFYRDTLYSVSSSLNIDGELDEERLTLGFDFLNRNLVFLIDRYPMPTTVTEGEIPVLGSDHPNDPE